jgi:hypothetical protein
VVELRNPVVGLVLLDEGGGTFTGSHRLVRDRLGKARSTGDRVHMARDRSRVDDTIGQRVVLQRPRTEDLRVETGGLEDLLLHDEESIGRGQEWQ